jgi:hypothetical protein
LFLHPDVMQAMLAIVQLERPFRPCRSGFSQSAENDRDQVGQVLGDQPRSETPRRIAMHPRRRAHPFFRMRIMLTFSFEKKKNAPFHLGFSF